MKRMMIVNPPSSYPVLLLLFLFVLTVGVGCGGGRPAAVPGAVSERLPPDLPPVPREFRAAWIATVDNIDWPSKPGLPVPDQQAEMRALLDRAAALNLNAVIFQVRPTADALYDSPFEPWSEYLTGESGRAPTPYYDPLAFAVEEAHRRGLELHAWFNPYRAFHPSAKGALAETHLSKTQPDIVKAYGTLLWLDPGEPAAADHSLRVMLDVVHRYDIDGVHLDDYFYPYPVQDSAGRPVEFPDAESYARARAYGVTMSRDDWRRDNVDRLIERLYTRIKAEKPWVKFGISPFGIWRPGNPASVTGFDAYASLYADARKWLVEGWGDYFTPQLYWRISSEGQSYPALLTWWEEQNVLGRHLWPGNYASRVILEGNSRWEPEELVEQVRLTRASPGAGGNVHFSMKALMPDRSDLGARFAEAVYGTAALVPASPWLGDRRVGRPIAMLDRLAGTLQLTLRPASGESVWQWIIQTRDRNGWKTQIAPGWQQLHRFENTEPSQVVVTPISRTGVAGPAVVVEGL